MYRLTLDVPYRFIVRPAYERAAHAIDLVPDTMQNIYHDRGAGIIILTPSTLDDRWQQHTIQLSEINKQSDYWREVKRGLFLSTPATFMGAVFPAGQSRTLIELLVNIAIIAIDATRVKWVAETLVSLDRDEGWAIHLQCANDEYTRDGDYWYAQWDRYAVRMDTRGMFECYRYEDRANLTQPPKLIARWYSGVSAPVRSALSVAMLPLPPLGLLVLTVVSGGTSLAQSTASSTTRQLVSSKLIPLFADCENIGAENAPIYSLCRPSPIRLAVNIRYNPIVAFERVRYPATGTLIERPFAVPPINPQVPSATPIVGLTRERTVSAAFEYLTDSGWANWNSAQSPEQARATLQLSTADTRYTPIVVGYFMRCEPLIATRATAPVRVERLLELELTRDEYAREEGYADCVLETDPARLIATRGDTTYRLEYSDDGVAWYTLSEGFASVERIELMRPRASGLPYRVRFALRGMWSRFGEIFQLGESAFDFVRLGDAVNKVLEGCGFEPISALPPALQAIRLPAAAQGDTTSGWRYAPRVGQSGEEILRTLLLFATASGQEWRLRWDYGSGKWALEPKPGGTPAWALYDAGTADAGLRQARYSELTLEPRPPEASVVYVEGATAPSKEGERLIAVLVNEDALTEPRSLDYLGRYKLIRVRAEALDTIESVRQLAERLYVAACRHAIDATVVIPLAPTYPAALLELLMPPRQVEVYANSVLVMTGYVKQAILSASAQPPRAELRLTLSTRYESDPRE